jgi:hypothetical protein
LQVLGKPLLMEMDPAPTADPVATIAASSHFSASPIALFFGPAPLLAANALDGCVGFSGVVAQYPHFTVEHSLVTPMAKCRWVAQAPGTFKGTTTQVATTTAKRVYCEVPVLPDEPRAALLEVSLSNDGYHFSDRKFAFPLFDPRLNITDQLMRTVENYYSMDLGIAANIDITVSSPAASGAQFSSTTLSWKNVREINGGFMKFTKLGVNTITGTVTSCSNVGAAPVPPVGVAPKFTITVTVKEFVGSDLPPALVNNLPPRAITVFLGDADPAKRVRYNVTLIASITSGGGTVTSGTMIFNFEHTKSFNLVGTGIGPLEISLTPSGPAAPQFTVAKLTTTIVSLNVTLSPTNILLDTETTVTVTLNRPSSVRLDLAMDGTGTITPSILFRESSVASFRMRSSAYGIIKISFTPNNANPLESPDFAQFAVVEREILVAEVVNATAVSPRFPRPLPAEVLVTTSSNMNVEFRVDILSGAATVGGLSASGRVVLANANSTKFTFTQLTPGLLKYRLVAVAGDILLGAGTTPRFAPSDFELVVDPVRVKLDLAPAIVQNELQTITAAIDLVSNVTFALAFDAGAATSALVVSRSNLSYPNVDTDRFTLRTAAFGPVKITMTVAGLNAPDFPAVQTFTTVVGGSVRADLPASMFVTTTRAVAFTLSGNASVAFDVTSTAGVSVSVTRVTFDANTTRSATGFPVVNVNVTAAAGVVGLASITLTPITSGAAAGADAAHFGPIVFTTNVARDPQIACAAGLSTCPDRVSCRANLADCPTASVCPLNMPVRCADGQCARSTAACLASPLPACASGSVRCPGDLGCAATVHECPTSVTCPAALPVKCYDGTCRSTVLDCPAAPVCAAGLFPCPSGSCAAGPDQCPRGRVCAQGETLCAELTCRSSGSQCTTGSGTGSTANAIGSAVCPPALPTLCPDGNCLPSGSSCAKPACPAGRPTRCETGECAASAAQCASTNGCPAASRVKCPDGTCAASTAACPPNSASCSTPGRTELCPDGSCAATQAQCPSEAGCPADAPMLCADKVNCVNLGVQSCPPAEVCDPRAPYRCASGLCVPSKALCPVTRPLPRCTGSTPVACADGSCQATSAACFTIKACPADRPFRCASGDCRSDESRCPLTQQGTCSAAEGYPLQCSGGECASERAECTESNGCTARAPFKCAGGACAANSAACPADSLIANGCPARTPHRCPDGACVTVANKDTECRALGGCPLASPVRCADGSCAATDGACLAKPTQRCAAATPISCPDGSCVGDKRECRTPSGCPLGTPHRCADGSCRARLAGEPGPDTCAAAPTCTAHPTASVLCDDGSCADSTASCPPLPSCPVNQPVRCPNSLECRATSADCERFRCPLGKPVFCIDTGLCVATSDTCDVPTCPDPSKPFRCAWGDCVASYDSCRSLSTCDNDRLPYLCPDGSCRIDAADCPFVTACPVTLPFRCPDGQCASSSNACISRRGGPTAAALPSRPSSRGASPESASSGSESSASTDHHQLAVRQASSSAGCPEGTTRCASGECLPTAQQCVSFLGCASPTPHQCPTGLCATSALGCSLGCGDGEFRCRDNTCRRVASDCPSHRVPLLSGIIVTHLVGAQATFKILSAAGLEAEVGVPAGAIDTPQRVINFAVTRRPGSQLVGMPWKPEENLVTSTLELAAYIADRSTLAPETRFAARSDISMAWAAGAYLISSSSSLCLAEMTADLAQLQASGCTSPVSARGGDQLVGQTRALAPHGIVRSTASFGAIDAGSGIGAPDITGSSGLSNGAIVGIVFACVFLLLLILLLIVYCIRQRRSKLQALKDAAADKAAKQAALVEIAEDESISLKDKALLAGGAPTRAMRAAQAAQAPGAPLSVPVLAPKPRVKTIDTLPPLVTKRPPQTVVPYRTQLPTLFASDAAGKAAAPLVDSRKPKTVDLATLHRTTTEGLERSGAEDERPVFRRSETGALHGSGVHTSSGLNPGIARAIHESGASSVHSSLGASGSGGGGAMAPRTPPVPASQRKGRLFANALGTGSSASATGSTQAMPRLPERGVGRGGPGVAEAGVEDEVPVGFGLGPTATARTQGGRVNERLEERLPGHIQDEDDDKLNSSGGRKNFEKNMP